ncbi:DUF1202 family protein [Shigella flexneri]
MSFNKQNDSEAFAVKYDKEVYQPAIAACHEQSEECYEVPIQRKRDFRYINEPARRQTFCNHEKLHIWGLGITGSMFQKGNP